jgi:hypothetical protein
MKRKVILTGIVLILAICIKAQGTDTPVLITLKNGETINAIHFGQLKCGTNNYVQTFILIRGKYMGSVTEIKDYKDIEKIVPQGYKAAPAASVGNEKGKLVITKKTGVSVALDDAEFSLSCYRPGDKYNEIIVQIMNPVTNQSAEHKIEVRNIQSIIFK